ncbi:MAG: MarR family winged helix-turn-helix transcriptional regulator [Gammaproteobacteria bacterium]
MANKKRARKAKPRSPVITIPSMSNQESDRLLRTILWDFFSISNHMGRIRTYWASLTGITGPQWNILMAVDHLDKGVGVPVGEIANKLHVKSTFVTAQSKLMEKTGHLRRIQSKSDRRVVLLSLTPATITRLNGFHKNRQRVNGMVFGEFSAQEFRYLVEQMEGIRFRVERALALLKSEIN